MLNDLVAALHDAATEKDQWRLQLTAERSLAPRDMAKLIEYSPALPGPVQVWLGKIAELGGFAGTPPQRFTAEIITPHIRFYRDPAVPPGQKRLIVGFCGNANRLMLPISCFLQQLPSDLCDVVVLHDALRTHYSGGVPPYAGSLLALIRRLLADFEADTYHRRYCFGTSMGGFVALRAGLLGKVDRAISVGGTFAWHPRRLAAEPHKALPAFDPLCRCVEAETLLISVYSADHAGDREHTRLLAAMRPVVDLGIEEISEHNVIESLTRAGRVRALLDRVFELDQNNTELEARSSA